MKRILLIAIIVIPLSGCSLLKSPFALFKMNKPQQEQKYDMHEILKRQPKIVKIQKNWAGQEYAYIGEELTHEITTNYQQYNKKLSLWQKFMNLGKQGIIIVIVLGILALVFPPVAMILGMSGRVLGFGTKKIVRGVEKGLANLESAEREKFLKTLSQEYDDKTKKLVSKIKHAN